MGRAKYLLIFLFGLFLFLLGTQKIHAATNDPTSEVGVVINEVMANPSCVLPINSNCDSDLEWIELYNSGEENVDLSGWTIDSTTIPEGIEIPKESFLVIARELVDGSDADTDSFESVWGNNSGIWGDDLSEDYLAIDGSMSLNNDSADFLTLNNQETFSWGEAEDGFSLERINPLMPLFNIDDVDYSNQDISLVPGGTPGAQNSVFELVPPLPPPDPVYSDAIIINEILPHPANGSGNEFIELYNTGTEEVDLSGWYLDDIQDGGSNPYKIPPETKIKPGEYIAFYKNPTIILNDGGDMARLLFPNSEEADTCSYTNALIGLSWARDSGVWQWTIEITPAAINIISVPVVEETIVNEEEDIPKNTAPIEIKTGEIKNHEDYLVKITGTVVETSGNTFYLDDGSGKAKVYIQAATGIDKPEMHSGDIFEVTGIVNLYRNIWRVLPQKQDDIKLIKAKKEEVRDNEVSVKKAAVKSVAASKSKSVTTTAKARAPTTKKVASASDKTLNPNIQSTQVGGYKSSFWIEMVKVFVGLSAVFLVILILKLWRMKKYNPPIGGNFGDDLT